MFVFTFKQVKNHAFFLFLFFLNIYIFYLSTAVDTMHERVKWYTDWMNSLVIIAHCIHSSPSSGQCSRTMILNIQTRPERVFFRAKQLNVDLAELNLTDVFRLMTQNEGKESLEEHHWERYQVSEGWRLQTGTLVNVTGGRAVTLCSSLKKPSIINDKIRVWLINILL